MSIYKKKKEEEEVIKTRFAQYLAKRQSLTSFALL